MAQEKIQGKILGGLRAANFGLLVFAPVVLINFMQMISVLWRYANPRLFRQYNSFWGHVYWSYTDWIACRFGGLRLEITGDKLPEGENAIVIANHQSAVDIVVQLGVGRRNGRLRDMKFFVKDIIKFVPGPGWGMLFLDCIFMKRNWTEDRERVLKQLQYFKHNHVPVWVNIYVEGTRLKPKKLAAAQAFAQAQGLPLPQRVLIPRVRGFLATLEGLEGHVQAVYDLTIAYSEQAPTLWDLLSGQGPRVRVEIRRFAIDALPPTQDARGAWLLQLFREKDQQIERMVKSF